MRKKKQEPVCPADDDEVVVVGTYARAGGGQVKSHTRRRPGAAPAYQAAAKGARPYDEISEELEAFGRGVEPPKVVILHPERMPAVQAQVVEAQPVEQPVAVEPQEKASRGDTLFIGGSMAGGGACNFVLQLGTMEAMFPGYGAIAAAGLVLTEMGVGHAVETTKDKGIRGFLFALLLGFGVLEAFLPFIREVAVHQQATQAAVQDTAAATEQCVPKDPPKEYGTQRLPMWLAAEKVRMDDCRAHQDKLAEKRQSTLTAAADEHSMFETPVRMLFGLLLSLATGGMARSLRGRK